MKVRRLFIGLNVAVVAVALTLFGMVAFSSSGDSGSGSDLSISAEVGSFLIGTLSMATGVGFVSYGVMLTKNLTQDFASKHATRIFRVACVCSVSFVVESVIVVYSAVQTEQFDANFEVLNSIYLSFDLLCMSAVLVLFYSDSDRVQDEDSIATQSSRTQGSCTSHPFISPSHFS
jgi:hypothetical protein